MNTPRDDLQDFLSGDDPLNAHYARRDKLEPPAALDAAILNAAREHAKRPARPRWFVPVSVAATVVLGTGLAVKQLSSPMRTISESAVHEAMTDDAMSSIETVAPMADHASGAARVPRPSMDAIPRIDVESDFAPEPPVVDLDEARRGVRKQVPLPAPELTPPPVARSETSETAARPANQATTPAPIAPAPAPVARATPEESAVKQATPDQAIAENDRSPLAARKSAAEESDSEAAGIQALRGASSSAEQVAGSKAAADARAYDQATRREDEEIAAAGAAAARRMRARTSSAPAALSHFGGELYETPVDGLPPRVLEGSSERKLDEVVSALQANRLREAKGIYKLWRGTIDEIDAQLGDSARRDDVRIDVKADTLDRIRALHAAGDTRTAQRLLDVLVEIYPDVALPTDLPLAPSQSR